MSDDDADSCGSNNSSSSVSSSFLSLLSLPSAVDQAQLLHFTLSTSSVPSSASSSSTELSFDSRPLAGPHPIDGIVLPRDVHQPAMQAHYEVTRSHLHVQPLTSAAVLQRPRRQRRKDQAALTSLHMKYDLSPPRGFELDFGSPLSPSKRSVSSGSVLNEPHSPGGLSSSSSSWPAGSSFHNTHSPSFASHSSQSTNTPTSVQQLQMSVAHERVGMDPPQQYVKQIARGVNKAEHSANEHSTSGVSFGSGWGKEEQAVEGDKRQAENHNVNDTNKRQKRQPSQHEHRGSDVASASPMPTAAITSSTTSGPTSSPPSTFINAAIKVGHSPPVPECIKKEVGRLRTSLNHQLLIGLGCDRQETAGKGISRYLCRFCGQCPGSQQPHVGVSGGPPLPSKPKSKSKTPGGSASTPKKPRAWDKLHALGHILRCLRARDFEGALWMRDLWPLLVSAFDQCKLHANCDNLNCYAHVINYALSELDRRLVQQHSPSAELMASHCVPVPVQADVCCVTNQYRHTIQEPHWWNNATAAAGSHHSTLLTATPALVPQTRPVRSLAVCLDRGDGGPLREGHIEVLQDTMDGVELVRSILQAILTADELRQSSLHWRCTALLQCGVELCWHSVVGGSDIPLACVNTLSSPPVDLASTPPGAQALKLCVTRERRMQRTDDHSGGTDNDQSRDGRERDGENGRSYRQSPLLSNPSVVRGQPSALPTSRSTTHCPPSQQRAADADEAVSALPRCSQWALEQMQLVHPALGMPVTQWAEERQCRPLQDWFKMLRLLAANPPEAGVEADAGRCCESDMEEEEDEEEEQEQGDDQRMIDQDANRPQLSCAISHEALIDVDDNSHNHDMEQRICRSVVENGDKQDDRTAAFEFTMQGNTPSLCIFNIPGLFESDVKTNERDIREMNAAFVQAPRAVIGCVFSRPNGLLEPLRVQRVERYCGMFDSTTQRMDEARQSHSPAPSSFASVLKYVASTVRLTGHYLADRALDHTRQAEDLMTYADEAMTRLRNSTLVNSVGSLTPHALSELRWVAAATDILLPFRAETVGWASLGIRNEFLWNTMMVLQRQLQRVEDQWRAVRLKQSQALFRDTALLCSASLPMWGWAAGLLPWCTLFHSPSSDYRASSNNARRRTREESRRERERRPRGALLPFMSVRRFTPTQQSEMALPVTVESSLWPPGVRVSSRSPSSLRLISSHPALCTENDQHDSMRGKHQPQPNPVVSSALGSPSASSASTSLQPPHRIALCIGNTVYPGTPLKPPVNDATYLASYLHSRLGFNVDVACDANKLSMENTFEQFLSGIQPHSVVVFYFSGHGCEVDGVNYLMPVTEPHRQGQVNIRDDGVSAQWMQQKVREKKPAFLLFVLDVCRSHRLLGHKDCAGLAAMEPLGSLLLYSCAPGRCTSRAVDKSSNSPLTTHLMQHLHHGEIHVAMSMVIRDVYASTKEQLPWSRTDMTDDFYLDSESEVEKTPPVHPTTQFPVIRSRLAPRPFGFGGDTAPVTSCSRHQSHNLTPISVPPEESTDHVEYQALVCAVDNHTTVSLLDLPSTSAISGLSIYPSSTVSPSLPALPPLISLVNEAQTQPSAFTSRPMMTYAGRSTCYDISWSIDDAFYWPIAVSSLSSSQPHSLDLFASSHCSFAIAREKSIPAIIDCGCNIWDRLRQDLVQPATEIDRDQPMVHWHRSSGVPSDGAVNEEEKCDERQHTALDNTSEQHHFEQHVSSARSSHELQRLAVEWLRARPGRVLTACMIALMERLSARPFQLTVKRRQQGAAASTLSTRSSSSGCKRSHSELSADDDIGGGSSGGSSGGGICGGQCDHQSSPVSSASFAVESSSSSDAPAAACIIASGYVQRGWQHRPMVIDFPFPTPLAFIYRHRLSSDAGDVQFEAFDPSRCPRCQSKPFSSTSNAASHFAEGLHGHHDPVFVEYDPESGRWKWRLRNRRSANMQKKQRRR